MTDTVEPLVLDLLEWIEKAPRPYSEVIEVWRTSCPRLPVWEEANALGFVDRRRRVGSEAWVSVSAAGQVFLRTRRPQARPPTSVVTASSASQTATAAPAGTMSSTPNSPVYPVRQSVTELPATDTSAKAM